MVTVYTEKYLNSCWNGEGIALKETQESQCGELEGDAQTMMDSAMFRDDLAVTVAQMKIAC